MTDDVMRRGALFIREAAIDWDVVPRGSYLRDIPALKYIYNTVSTSDYSVREAIEAYDQERTRQLERARVYEQQRANEIASEQNELLEEQNAIAEKSRKDAQKAAFVASVQRHNLNKSANECRFVNDVLQEGD